MDNKELLNLLIQIEEKTYDSLNNDFSKEVKNIYNVNYEVSRLIDQIEH